MNTLNLKNYVQDLRDAARTKLRLKIVADLLVSISAISKDIRSSEECVQMIQKEIERNNYKISKLEETNPDYKELKENLEKNNEQETKLMEQEMKSVVESGVSLEKLDKEIERVTNGEVKVSLSTLNSMVNEELTTTSLKELTTEETEA